MAMIGLEDHGRSMTLAEFLAVDAVEGYRYELVRGVLHAEDVPEEDHCQVVSNLYGIVAHYNQLQPGLILRFGGGANFLLRLSEADSALRPDLGVVLRRPADIPPGRRDPVLVAEVVSEESGERDRCLKREDYLAFGILEYWIVDLRARRLIILIREGDAWMEHTCKDDERITSVILPGLSATVADLWEDIEDGEGI